MIIDNRKRETAIRARALLRAIASVIAVAFIQSLKVFEKDLFGLTKGQWSLVILFIYLVFSAYHFYMDYYYLCLQIKKNNLIVRYYSLRPFSTKKTFLLPLTELIKADIQKKGNWGKKYLILYRQSNGKSVAYPSIGLSAMSNQQMGALRQLLKRLFKSNNSVGK